MPGNTSLTTTVKRQWKKPIPSSYTAELGAAILAEVEAGQPIELAAEANGISRGVVYGWMRDGSTGLNDTLAKFWTDYQKVRARFAGELTRDVLKGVREKRPDIGLEMLRRRFPDLWAEPAKLIEMRVSKQSDEELTIRALEIARQLAAQGLLPERAEYEALPVPDAELADD
jgi:hypothetical protein